MHNTEDPQGYEDTKKLRYLERKVRESKRLEAVAIDDDALRQATRRKLDYQAKIRHHVATTKAKRQRWRESFGVSKKKLAAERAVAGQAAKVAPKVDRFAELATKRSAKTWPTLNAKKFWC
jgi:hypothetical protein